MHYFSRPLSAGGSGLVAVANALVFAQGNMVLGYVFFKRRGAATELLFIPGVVIDKINQTAVSIILR